MTKCLYVSRYFYPFTGGAEISAFTLLQGLLESDIECEAICSASDDCVIDADGITVSLAKDPLLCMREVLCKSPPDVVLTQLEFASEAIEYAEQAGIPAILRVPSWEQFCRAPDKFATCDWPCTDGQPCQHRVDFTDTFEKARSVIAISEYVAAAIKRFYNRDAIMIRPPVERARYEVSSRIERCITMARGHVLKGAEFFIALAAQLSDKPFMLCGKCDPPIEEAARPVCNIDCCGFKEDMREVYSQTSIYLAPVVWAEPFGRTLVEAMINGIPVIGSDRGAIPEVLGDAGLVLPLELDRWKAAILRLLEDRKFYRDVSARCLRRSFHFNADSEKRAFVSQVLSLVRRNNS